MAQEVKYFKLNSLPLSPEKGGIYFIPNGNGDDVDMYIANRDGTAFIFVGRTGSSIVVEAGGVSAPVNYLSFGNANNVTFGFNSLISQITASINPPVGAAFTAGMSNLGNTAGNTGTVTNRLIFAGGSNITLSQQTAVGGNTITIHGATVAQSEQTQNVHNVSLGGTNTLGILADISSGTMILAGGNNITLSQAGNNITILGGGGGNMSILGSTGDISFANSNGFSFIGNNSTIVGSYTVPTDYVSIGQSSLFLLTSQSSLFQHTSATSAITSNALNTSQSSLFQHTSAMSDFLGTTYTTHTHTQLAQAISGSNGSFTFETASFGSSNGMHFYTTNGSIVGSYTVPTVTNSSMTFEDFDNGTFTAGHFALDSLGAWAGAQGVGFSFSTGAGGSLTLYGVHNGLTTQSGQAFSAGLASSTFETLVFQDSAGISFSNNAGSIRLTHGLQFTSNTSDITSNALNTSQSSLFQHTSATSAITSNAVHTSAALIKAIIGSNTTYTSGSVGLRDLNGITWQSTTGQSFQITHELQYTSNTSAITSNALNTSASRVMNIIAATNSTGGGTASLSSNVSFSNTHNFTFFTSAGNAIVASFHNTALAGVGTTFNKTNVTGGMTLNSNGLRLDIEVAAPGAAAENNWINLLGANTAGNTTASGSTIGWSGINVTLSGTNDSVINVSGPAQFTFSGFNPYDDLQYTFTTNQGSLMIDRINIPNIQFDRVVLAMNNTNATNSSGSHTISFWIGIYTQNASTLSLVQSASSSTAVTHSGTVGSYSHYSGLRLFSIPMTGTLTEGRYWVGFVSRTTSGGANGSYSVAAVTQLASNFLGHFGSAHNTTYQFALGKGVYNTTTSGIPNSIGFNQIRGSDGAVLRPTVLQFVSSTI